MRLLKGSCGPCICLDPESLAAVQDSVVMEMVDKGEACVATKAEKG